MSEELASAGAASVYVPPAIEPAVLPTIMPARAPVPAVVRLPEPMHLPPLFKHERPTANPPKGTFGALARSLGAVSNNRLVLKDTQLLAERFEELGYDGVFGRYYRLANSYLSGIKTTSLLGDPMVPESVKNAFLAVRTIRLAFFENLKRALMRQSHLSADEFRGIVELASLSLRRQTDLPESLKSELTVFLYILDFRYDIEIDHIAMYLRGRGAPARRRRTRRLQKERRRRNYTRR